MVTLSLSDDQVVELVKQIPYEKQKILFQFLLEQQQQRWQELSLEGQAGVRTAAAERGKDWDKMSEEEKEDFINDLVHEDR
ncbi:MAG: hypothetical protein HC916_11220 [Coleofasciculaceae cyanobacterium SM2_1_6]|nr:hypothetical protein [Coleofasciculaceae cyanobacterium SM2_1_6]